MTHDTPPEPVSPVPIETPETPAPGSPEAIAAALKSARRAAGFSIRGFALISGQSKSTVARLAAAEGISTAMVHGDDGHIYSNAETLGVRRSLHLTLRSRGLSFRTIAAMTGYDVATVYRDCTRFSLGPIEPRDDA
jgi:hypothetical protein